MKRTRVGWVFGIFAILTISACSQAPDARGFLEGEVTIGPLVPVVRPGETEPTPAPEVYEARKIVVYEEDGKTEVLRIDINANGSYRAELPVGTYIVDINRIGVDSASNLPMTIDILEQQVTRLDIDIDTGIR